MDVITQGASPSLIKVKLLHNTRSGLPSVPLMT